MTSYVLTLLLDIVPITCLVGILYAICRYTYIKRHRQPFSWLTEIIRFLFVCHLTGLVNLVLVPSNLWRYIWFYSKNGYAGAALSPLFSGGFNFIPSLVKCLMGDLALGSWVRSMLAGNLLMFVPMGFFLPLAFRSVTGRNILLYAVGVPLLAELLQPVFGRSFDADDLICNFLGIMIGYAIAALLRSSLDKKRLPCHNEDTI